VRYVALLRGINVGGRNKVPMADLREVFEDAGFDSVRTYIQSGNVLFESKRAQKGLEDEIERALERHFRIPLVVVVRSHRQLDAIVKKAPRGFGTQPSKHHCDVLFLKSPLTVKKAVSAMQLREGVDELWPGTGVVYFRRLSARRVQSKLPKFAGTPEYQLTTIRSWSTTTKLLDMLDA
jgi:uncharacterized protein (DUF1697 family)